MKYICAICLVFLYANSFSQLQKETKYEKKSGDTMPDHTFNNVIHYKSDKLNVADFNGKILILDFWSTGCTSCIRSWPKLVELQNQFKDDLQIVLVNPWEDKKKVEAILKRRAQLNFAPVTLPMVCGDSSILNYFPIHGVPYIIWINKKGIVASITDGNVMNAENLKQIIQHDSIRLHQQSNASVEINPFKPLFVDDNGGAGQNLLFQSTFASARDGMGVTFNMFTDSVAGSGIYIYGEPRFLFRFACSNNFSILPGGMATVKFVPESRVIIKDNAEEVFSERDGWRPGKFIAYQLLAKKAFNQHDLLNFMRQDLLRQFGYDGIWIKEKTKCFVVSPESRIAYKKGEHLYWITQTELKFNKVTLKEIIDWLELRYDIHPYVTDMPLNFLIGDINIEGDFTTIDKLVQILGKHGIKITLENRETELLVIKRH